MKRHEFGLWEDAKHIWPLRDDNLVYAMLTEGSSIFILLSRSQRLSPNHESDISLTKFRNNLLNPMTRLGLDVKMHARDIY